MGKGRIAVRVVPNKSGIKNYLRASKNDPAMISVLQDTSMKLAREAGHGFVAKQMKRRVNRPGFIVYAAYKESQGVQVREARLQKAVQRMSRTQSVVPGLRA